MAKPKKPNEIFQMVHEKVFSYLSKPFSRKFVKIFEKFSTLDHFKLLFTVCVTVGIAFCPALSTWTEIAIFYTTFLYKMITNSQNIVCVQKKEITSVSYY